jgi:transcriptional regulator with XRE-family HTH domain
VNAVVEIEAQQTVGAVDLASGMRAKRLQQLLQGRREHLKLSQEDVAARLGISSRAYGNWERGRVKEWTDQKLYALAEALEMTEFQTDRLFWIAVDRAPQPDLRAMTGHSSEGDTATAAFLVDYSVMMEALSLPTVLINHRWDVKMANSAYSELFRNIRPHPTAMPADNFLRFGLFHPDAPSILVDHLTWRLSMLAQLATSLDRHDQDPALQAIRREVYLHPILRDAYLNDMPTWVLGAGADLVHHEGEVRELRHPDPRVGLQGCRLVEETPRPLQARGLTRITLVLTDLTDRATSESGRCHDHHAA